jgi:hypothetical protein
VELSIPKTRLNSIPRFPSSYPGGLRLEIRLYSNDLLCPFIAPRHGPNKKDSLSMLGRRIYSSVAKQPKLPDCCLRIRYRRTVFTESLPSNERLLWLCYSGFRVSCHSIYKHSHSSVGKGYVRSTICTNENHFWTWKMLMNHSENYICNQLLR